MGKREVFWSNAAIARPALPAPLVEEDKTRERLLYGNNIVTRTAPLLPRLVDLAGFALSLLRLSATTFMAKGKKTEYYTACDWFEG